MKMAQFYNPNNSLNRIEYKSNLLGLSKRIEGIKTRNHIILSQATESKQIKHQAKSSPNKGITPSGN